MDEDKFLCREHPRRVNCFHTVNETGKAAVVKNAEKIEKKNRDIQICLGCKKKKCTGTNLCFEKERKKKND